MRKPLNKLSQMFIDEVSLVDNGGNQHADLVLSKNEDGDGSLFSRIVKNTFGNGEEGESTTGDQEGGNIPGMSEETSEGVEKAGMGMPGMGAPGMGAPAPQQQQMPQQAQLPPEVVAYIQQLEQLVAQAQGQGQQGQQESSNVNPFGKSAEEEVDEDAQFLAELAKNLEDEDVREAISKANEIVAKANERAEAAEKIAKEERDVRLQREWVEKAKAYTNLSGDPEELGAILRKASESLDDEQYEALTKTLTAANEGLGQSELFGEFGKRGGGAFEPISKLDAKAEEIRKDSTEDITIEKAKELAIEANPELYDEYVNQR